MGHPRVRIYQLAQQLHRHCQEIQSVCQQLQIPADHHLRTVTHLEAAQIALKLKPLRTHEAVDNVCLSLTPTAQESTTRRFRPRSLAAAVPTSHLFDQIRQRDLLVSQAGTPATSLLPAFVAQAASDPEVLTIKLLIAQAAIAPAFTADLQLSLTTAIESGKQVVVLVLTEPQSQFQPMDWVQDLQAIGVHVMFRRLQLPACHNLALIVRREGLRLQRYTYLCTDADQSVNAPVEVGLLSCQEPLGAEVSQFFNRLTGKSPVPLQPRLLRVSAS